MARNLDSQVAEVLICIAVMNSYTALGIPVTRTVSEVFQGKGNFTSIQFALQSY
jgi:hypothetical protein